MDKKIVCIIQARTGSTRLPNKVLFDLEGKPVLLRVIDRVLGSKKIDQIVIATTVKANDQRIIDLIKDYHPKVDFFIGSEQDVLDRYYQTAKKFRADIIVRVCSDCPLIDSEAIDKVIDVFLRTNNDYVGNNLGVKTYPLGFAVEVFSFESLSKSWKQAKPDLEREHVVPYIRNHPEFFKCKNVINDIDYSYHRWTLDEKDDYELIKTIYKRLYSKKPNFKMKDILDLFEKNPNLIKINQHVKQVPDYKKS